MLPEEKIEEEKEKKEENDPNRWMRMPAVGGPNSLPRWAHDEDYY